MIGYLATNLPLLEALGPAAHGRRRSAAPAAGRELPRLGELLEGAVVAAKGSLDRPVAGLATDFRRVVPGTAYFSLSRGADAARAIGEALESSGMDREDLQVVERLAAIVVGAAIMNGLKVVGKDLASVKLVVSGAGAAALACLGLLVKLGMPRKNIWVTDLAGVVYEGRTVLMDRWKAIYAQATDKRTLADVIGGADVFLGLSGPKVLTSSSTFSLRRSP